MECLVAPTGAEVIVFSTMLQVKPSRFWRQTHVADWILHDRDEFLHLESELVCQVTVGVLIDENLAQEIRGLNDLGVSERIEHLFSLSASNDDVCFAQYGQVLTDIGLGQVQHGVDIVDREFLITQQVHDLQAARMCECFEELRVQLEHVGVHIHIIEYVFRASRMSFVVTCVAGTTLFQVYGLDQGSFQ